ncbi:nucleotidyl transferase AbiEii/AbiGii toxin family protein [Catellatospora sichuanensis]|uniref:nucleotidyl transferase AbiEii/AbiGii toxin family protein n=1 Tax=Catellatospora sichuanensis TaxID=1969805 RepID=UPI001182B3BF|nr:nucleotidyl transferase AbiEii/AbiGii toxin family protein [Catellatospora sichuanensis]
MGEVAAEFEQTSSGRARLRAARRAALDHVLALVAAAPCGESLVLRGSMAMLAWAGEQARDPGDLDWVVRPLAWVPIDLAHPYPYLNKLDKVRTWPEAAHGATGDEMWDPEDFDTGGIRALLPPEGLRWMLPVGRMDLDRPHEDVLALVEEQPRAAAGVLFDPEAAVLDHAWAYAYDDEYGAGGTRLLLPWRVDDTVHGTLQLDFSYDERLPEAPVVTAIPRADGGPPTTVWTASPELSLAWKLQWLHADQASTGSSAGKDLYDAMLLAERDGMRLPDLLRRRLLRRVSDPDAFHPDRVRSWRIDRPGGKTKQQAAAPWLERLVAALPAVLDS